MNKQEWWPPIEEERELPGVECMSDEQLLTLRDETLEISPIGHAGPAADLTGEIEVEMIHRFEA